MIFNQIPKLLTVSQEIIFYPDIIYIINKNLQTWLLIQKLLPLLLSNIALLPPSSQFFLKLLYEY